ncbi:bifunctional Delta(1)-pyrroline-2-carboxylate/Delta(1)-piperideine-2-carboxylate reductase [Cupriavidus pampae]|uniref:Delta(1)-pyrroline-2-carboxylate reductase n=1 Tax=Cupriavidus pampae TaxID=659251 RepID=A0ABN7ZD96_9BURK|nr:ornithine cyclodeaminase family protein [Cupriavidus pampae]CAG9182970.1 Delta(1)-pyrroline-2-carboxylate reductase [Cupriavidus pampae]
MLQPEAALLRDLLSFPLLVSALRDAFAAGATVPLRHTHTIGEAGQPDAGISLLMPAWDAEGFYGVKIVNIYEGNAAHGLPGLHSTYMLYSARTGAPLAMFDGNEITSRRTAAAAALAADYLARPDARSLLVVGAGRVGSLVAPAMATVRQLDRIEIWDIDASAAARCAQALREQGLPASAATDLEHAVRAADIVSCATLATSPLIHAEWLAAGSHLDLIGSFTPRMTEAEPACFANASVWVDTDEAPAKSGDLLNAFAAGCLTPESLRGNLTGLARGTCAGRQSATERTVFKAVGTALEDLASARLAYRQLTASQH